MESFEPPNDEETTYVMLPQLFGNLLKLSSWKSSFGTHLGTSNQGPTVDWFPGQVDKVVGEKTLKAIGETHWFVSSLFWEVQLWL